jgi:hypothetical protein
MDEEVFELRIPVLIRRFESSRQDDLLHVVVQDLPGITSKVLERVNVTLDQGMNVGSKGEFGRSHPGIAKDHGKTVELSPRAVDLDITAFCPVDLGLDSGLRLVAIYFRNTDFGSYLSNIVFYDRIFALESLSKEKAW